MDDDEERKRWVGSVREECTSLGIVKRMIPTEEVLERLGGSVGVEIPPVSGVVGGIIGREVVKALTGKDEPLHNLFFFDAVRSAGVVESL